MDKIIEALSKLLPEDKVEPVTGAVREFLEESSGVLEAEYNKKLEEAYAQVSKELKDSEQTAEQGYQESYQIITDLRNRLETQKVEFEQQLEHGYEEAYQMLVAEKGKNENIEVDMYEEYDKKLADMKEHMVDKLDQFLQYKGHEIYEQARRDIVSDPRTVEHRVALEKVVDVVSDYISDEDFAAVTSSKFEENRQKVDDLEGQKKILEARNIRLSTENNKLTEQVRQTNEVLTEATETKKERLEQVKNATGRGQKVTEGIIAEFKEETQVEEDPEVKDTTLVENMGEDFFEQMQVLSGLKTTD